MVNQEKSGLNKHKIREWLHGRNVSREGKLAQSRLDLESPLFNRALSYIHDFRIQTTKTQPQDDLENGAIGLGESPFLVPNKERFAMQFYWDSYFMMQPLLHSAEGRELAKSIIHNFSVLIERFGMIPNASAYEFLLVSQAPLYSSMILETYQHMPPEEQERNKEWLQTYMQYAKREYENVWDNKQDYLRDGIGSFHHRVEGFGLSKYGDRDAGYSINAERESGWDFTSRFGDRATEYLPIDLNSFLFKYAMDFAKAAEIQGNVEERDAWVKLAENRREEINHLMWNEQKGYFFDYIYTDRCQDDFYSLAPFTTLWAGMATPEQAKKMLKQLGRFNRGKGLMVTEKESKQRKIPRWLFQLIGVRRRNIPRIQYSLYGRENQKQWDYPNVWPPLEYITVKGLLRYSEDMRLSAEDRQAFKQTARTLMEDYLRTTGAIFEEEGTFSEKFDGITGKSGNGAHYDRQSGFGWTCATFEEFHALLKGLYSEEDGLVSARRYATIAS